MLIFWLQDARSIRGDRAEGLCQSDDFARPRICRDVRRLLHYIYTREGTKITPSSGETCSIAVMINRLMITHGRCRECALRSCSKHYLCRSVSKLNIWFSSIGAPAGGMNAATRAAVRYCLRQGHTPIAVNNGFAGLLDDNIHQFSWLGVDNWMTRGGSELGTNRTLPEADLGAIAAKFQQYRFHSLMMIGGFEAFNALLQLEQARSYYPAFHIPMVHLPATISNNVPLTEFSLGSDTSLNALVDACDAIKQSASASRNRVFVVETQGGKCGYLATMGALAVRTSYISSHIF